MCEIEKKRKITRRHSKIDMLPEETRLFVEGMIRDRAATYAEIVDYLKSEDISISPQSVGRYAQRYMQNLRMLEISQDNFRLIAEELNKYPELDTTEAIIRLMSNNIFNALTSVSQEDFEKMDVVDLLKQTNSLVKTAAYKKRTDTQNRDLFEQGLEQVKGLVFDAMSRENPELYKQVVTFLNEKKSGGMETLKDDLI